MAGRHVFLVLAVIVAMLPPRAQAAPLDWAVAGGQFYTQASGGAGAGFTVSDADAIPFLAELRRRGGPTALGYPISRRFEWKGTTVQVFQKAVLQWLPSQRQVAFLNVFDDLAQAGFDQWLRAVRSTPGQAWLDGEDRMPWDAIVQGRLAFLDANPAIKARYYAVPDPILLYGLPASRVEDMGNHLAIRLQRAVIQQWKVDVPWAKAGETTVANGGDIAKEAGMFAAAAVQPHLPDGTNASVALPTPVPTGLPVPIGTPLPGAGITPVAMPSAVNLPTTAPGGVSAPNATGTPVPAAATATGTPTPVPLAFRDPPIAQVPRAGAARTVVIDPGHGGGQVGSSAVLANGTRLYEKNLTLEVARRVTALLRQAGYQVTQTRDADIQTGGPTLPDDLQARIDLANAARADVFVSIHFNGLGNRAVRGIEVYFATDRPFTDDNRTLADLIYWQVGRQMAAAGYDANPRGVRADTTAAGDGDHFFILSPVTRRVKRATAMPGAIGEALFLSNDQDAEAVARPEIREAIARGYAVAIGTFLSGRRPASPSPTAAAG